MSANTQQTLKVNEIYHSIQGETSFAGRPCVFIRTTGCSLRCEWCDTDYAFYDGRELSLVDIINQVKLYDCQLVELTGGEPLDQPNAYELLHQLCEANYTVLLETGGHKPIESIDPRVHRIVDMKCPSSKMQKRNRMENLHHVSKMDEVKFVIGTREDYEWAIDIVRQYRLSEMTNPLFSTVYGELSPEDLIQWILEDQVQVRFQLQQHKIIWGDAQRGV